MPDQLLSEEEGGHTYCAIPKKICQELSVEHSLSMNGRKSFHGLFLDDDKTVKRSGTAKSFQDIEKWYKSNNTTLNNEEASTTSRCNTEDMTIILMNPSSYSITKKKLDVDDEKYTTVTPSPTTNTTYYKFPSYSCQSFGRATLSSLDITSFTLFLKENLDFDLTQTHYVFAPTICSNSSM